MGMFAATGAAVRFRLSGPAVQTAHPHTVRQVDPLPHRGRVAAASTCQEACDLAAPMRSRLTAGPGAQLEQVHKSVCQQAAARVEFRPPHALDLLDEIGPVDGVVHPLADREAAQQFGLLLGPDQDVAVIEIARHDCCSLALVPWGLSATLHRASNACLHLTAQPRVSARKCPDRRSRADPGGSGSAGRRSRPRRAPAGPRGSAAPPYGPRADAGTTRRRRRRPAVPR